MNGLRAERNVEFAPQIPDVDLDDIVVAFVVDVPYRLQNLLLGDDRIGVAHQVLEHPPVLAGRQLHLDAGSVHLVAGWV